MRLIDADEQFCEEASDGTGYVLTYDGGMYAVTNEFGHTVCEFLPEQPTVDAAPEWISVKEKLPKDDGYNGTVLATDGSIVIAAPSSSVTINGVIIHWMPLPDLPKMDGGDGE